jgi:hypothetical protein
MKDYKCDKCQGTTNNSELCENPECPNMPCCGKPKELCTCNDSEDNKVVIVKSIEDLKALPKEVQEAITSFVTGLEAKRQSRAKYSSIWFKLFKLLLVLLLIGNTVSAFYFLNVEEYLKMAFAMVCVLAFLYLLSIVNKLTERCNCPKCKERRRNN